MTDKQALFCKEYLVDLNATRAAIRAGYSQDTANRIGPENLSKPEIQEEVQRLMESRAKRTEVTADRVLLEFARIAFSNPKDVMDWGPNGIVLKDSDELGVDVIPAVAEVSETQSSQAHTIKIKMHDKVGALTQLGRHLGMFSDKIQHSFDLSSLSDEELGVFERLAAKATAKP